ncbi:MAG: glycosyltransferase [Fibrella sp.]|nr:glycosyltransferase [Armatimonadota bacterium]
MVNVGARPGPCVSVIIPTYKHRDLVLTTLDSVWSQTFTQYEVIVVNDGSPDDTEAVLKPLIESGRIRYVVQANGGQASARNRGIAEAKGEFIALLDDDDLWLPDKLEWQVQAFRSHPEAAAVYGRAEAIDELGKDTVPIGEDGKPLTLPWETPTGWVYEAFLRQNWILSPGQCLIRRTALDALGESTPFDAAPELRGCDDWDLWCRLAEAHTFLFQDRVALRYRFHSANASRDIFQMHRSTLFMCNKHLNRALANVAGVGGLSARRRIKLLRDTDREARRWSAHDLLHRARTLYARVNMGGDPALVETSLALLSYLLRTQPKYWLSPYVLWFLARVYRVSLIRRSRNRVSVPADVS